MPYQRYSIQQVNLHQPASKQEIEEFLTKLGLELEDDVEYTIAVRDPETQTLVGTGSLAHSIIKCVGVDPQHRGEGISPLILTELIKEAHNRGRHHLFVFTNPENIEETEGNVFQGFKLIAKTDDLALLEFGHKTIEDYLRGLQKYKREIPNPKHHPPVISAIVVNCNPFTLGHQYLIETAAKESDLVYVFVVSENKSLFPTDVRELLVRRGTAHLDNVIVIPGGPYIISPATFPRYFMKEYDDIVKSQARLDVTVFAEHFVPLFGITRRYVGEEPYCPVTRAYNEAMKEVLGKKGVELRIIPRREINGQAISASKVRELIRQDNFEALKELVPKTTYDFIVSQTPEAKRIIERIKSSRSRH